MTIGLRMGITALNLLDVKGWFDIRCEVRLNWSPPDSCVIDGIQSSTGCTMGKRNIVVVEQPGVEAIFTSKDKTLRIRLRDNIFQSIKKRLDEEGVTTELVEEVEKADLEELFEIELL